MEEVGFDDEVDECVEENGQREERIGNPLKCKA